MTSDSEKKHYDNDWAKSKSRDLVRDMIDSTLLTFRKPSQLKVLCLPGRNATEVHEVYDRLGIPRQNIVGLEMKSKYIPQIQRSAPGIQVINQTVEDYVASQPTLAFDIVSLDYTGPISENQMFTLTALRKKQQRDHFILHQANLLKRDQTSNSIYRTGYAIAGDFQLPDIQRRLEEVSDALEKGGESARDPKHVASTSLIKSLFWCSGESEVINNLAKKVFGVCAQVEISEMEKIIGRQIGKKVSLDINNMLESWEREVGMDRIRGMSYFRHCMVNYLRARLNEEGLSDSQGTANYLFEALGVAYQRERAFHTKNLKRYSYVSESGAPMVGDILFLSHSYKHKEACKNLASLIDVDNVNTNHRSNLISLTRAFQEVIKEDKKLRPDEGLKLDGEIMESPRLFLGSSAKPVLTKARAIEEMRNGASIEDLQRKYRGTTNKPLAQWKAHVTMGTYGPTNKAQEEIIVAEEDKDIEVISKEDAIDMLRSGIPTQEIFDAWPTSFTLGQLRAMKAHITMGTYKEKKETAK